MYEMTRLLSWRGKNGVSVYSVRLRLLFSALPFLIRGRLAIVLESKE